MNLTVYAKAGGVLGMGHVVRVSHLVQLFKARGHVVDIITNEVGQEYFDSQKIHSLNSRGRNIGMKADIAIVDHMLTDNEYLRSLRSGVKKLVVIVGAGHTITPEIRLIADLIIYHCPSREELYDVVPGEKILSGLNHLILNPIYAQESNDPKTRSFVSYFGGGADKSFALQMTTALRNELFTVSSRKPTAVWDDNLYTVLQQSTNFIGTMGMVTYEAINRGAHPFVFSRSHDHLEIAEQLEEMFLVTNMGMLPERGMNVKKYIKIIKKQLKKHKFLHCAKVDGKGAYRVAREILS